MDIKEVTESRSLPHLLHAFLSAELSRILLKTNYPIFPMVEVLVQMKDKYILLACIFFLDATLQETKEAGVWLTSLLPEIAHLRVALKCGRHLVHGSVEDMQEPVGSSYVPLYDFYILFASVEFKR